MKIFVNQSIIHLLPFSKKNENAKKIHSVEELMPFFEKLQDSKDAKMLFFRLKPYRSICQELTTRFTFIEAAGGIVEKKGKILWIHRNGKWDLPKGKIESGESKKKAAVREVEEECGVKAKLKEKIGKTWHTYRMGEKWVLKCTHWYAMETAEKQTLIPQAEEGITEVIWFSAKKSEKIAAQSYGSIQLIFEKYKTW